MSTGASRHAPPIVPPRTGGRRAAGDARAAPPRPAPPAPAGGGSRRAPPAARMGAPNPTGSGPFRSVQVRSGRRVRTHRAGESLRRDAREDRRVTTVGGTAGEPVAEPGDTPAR